MKRTSRLSFFAVGLVICSVVAACGQGFHAPALDESGSETATDVSERAPAAAAAADASRTLSLDQATNVRNLKSGVLEFVAELPPGSKITVPVDYAISQPNVRNSAGGVERSSTGFVAHVTIVSTPDGANNLSASQIKAFNKLVLYVSASVVGATEGVGGSFKAIAGASPGSAYLSLYNANGKPKFNYSAGLKKRFGLNVNKANDDAGTVSKSQKIMAQLQLVADRKVATPKLLLLIDKEAAKKFSLAYEQNGTVTSNGAWSIAVNSTAVRHGFENVPCAEFMSETIREAYQRAGSSVASDFGAKNPLLWSKTAAVVGLSQALYTAGWVAWEPSKFRPPTGAIMMHGSGISPGHTYIAAGDDGRIIVDNGSPQGRDLRTTSASILNMMYETGVFFLPPGMTPKPW